MKLKEDQSRIKELLKDTITLLCKNGLQYKAGFSVEALIGITLDEEDVFLVNIKESVRNEDAKDKSSGVEVTVQRRKIADGSESEHEGTPNKRNQTLISKNSRKRPPDGSPPPFDHASPAKQTRLHSEHDDASNTSSTHYQSEQSKDSAFNIKSEPNDDEDELVFVKQEGGNDYSSCSQGNPFTLGQMTPGQQTMPHISQTMLNPNFAFDPQTGATSSDSLPGISSWASSQAGGLDASGQTISAIPGSQGSQPKNLPWFSSSSPNTTSVVICPYCSKRYTDRRNLKAHMWKIHGDGEPKKCENCGKMFVWMSDYYRHKELCKAIMAKGSSEEKGNESAIDDVLAKGSCDKKGNESAIDDTFAMS